MYRSTTSFTTNDYDIRYKQILEDNFTSEEQIQEFLRIGYIEVYDGTLEITENGQYNVEDYQTADVDVPSGEPTLQSKEVTITENGTTTIKADTGYDGLSNVGVTVATSGIDTSDATATDRDIISGKTAYVKGNKITGNIPRYSSVYSAPSATRDFTVNTSFDTHLNITHHFQDNEAGYYSTFTSKNYLVPFENIVGKIGLTEGILKKGERVLGVTGIYEGEGGTSIPDWTELGYEGAPQSVIDDYNYSKNIKDNWDSSVTNLAGKFQNNSDLVYMPVVDMSNVTSMRDTFNRCNRLIEFPEFDLKNVTNFYETFKTCSMIKKISLAKIEKATDMTYIFENCYALQEVKIGNTSQLTNMYSMCMSCFALETINEFDTQNVTNMNYAFSSCNKLSDESLNNILKMCINATKISSSSKNLSYVGLSSEQATKCQTLPAWDDFVNAGWTTGY